MKRWMLCILFLYLASLVTGIGCSATQPVSFTATPIRALTMMQLPPTVVLASGPTPTQRVSPTSVSLSTPTPNPAGTPQPASNSISAHDELERALVSRVHWETHAVCEWEVLGQTPQDLYVWVVCESIAFPSSTPTQARSRI